MAYFNERDFLLASGKHTRQLWSERYLEYPMSPDEAWRLASHEFFRAKIERRLLDELGFSAIDLRPALDEDPGSPQYQELVASFLAQKETRTLVGAAVLCSYAFPHSCHRLHRWSDASRLEP